MDTLYYFVCLFLYCIIDTFYLLSTVLYPPPTHTLFHRSVLLCVVPGSNWLCFLALSSYITLSAWCLVLAIGELLRSKLAGPRTLHMFCNYTQQNNQIVKTPTKLQNCQAQPQLQLQPWLKAEIALFSISPPTQPPTRKSKIWLYQTLHQLESKLNFYPELGTT